MIDHSCDDELKTDSGFVDNLDHSQLRVLDRLASALNKSILQLFDMVSAASADFSHNENQSRLSNISCVDVLLSFAKTYWFENDGDFSFDGETPIDPHVRGTLDDDGRGDPRQRQPYVILGLICSVLMIAVAVFGIVGNAVSVWFFGRLSAKSSINTMLTAMAVFDCVLLLTGAPLYSLVGIHSYTGHDYLLRSLSCCLIYFYTISTMSQTATAWMLVLITFERYVAVCRPFLARRLCTLGRARKAVLSVSAFAIGYNVVRFWEFESDSETGDAKPLLREQPYYRSIYMHWMYLTLVFLVPFTIIAFFNALIIRTIRAARIGRRACRVHAGARSSSSNGGHAATRTQAEHRTAAMLLVVVLCFMLCECLAPVLNALEMVGKPTDQPVFAFLSDLNNLLILLHSTMNVGIYIGFCSEFRRVCRLVVPFVRRLFRCYAGTGKPLAHPSGSTFDFLVAQGSQRRRLGSISSANCVTCTPTSVGSSSQERFRLAKMDSSRRLCGERTRAATLVSRSGSAKLSNGSTCV